jgi:hypothetical protein
MQNYRVQRPLPYGDAVLPSGTLVDVSDWSPSRLRLLEKQRYVRPEPVERPVAVTPEESPPSDPEPRKKGRAVHAATTTH